VALCQGGAAASSPMSTPCARLYRTARHIARRCIHCIRLHGYIACGHAKQGALQQAACRRRIMCQRLVFPNFGISAGLIRRAHLLPAPCGLVPRFSFGMSARFISLTSCTRHSPARNMACRAHGVDVGEDTAGPHLQSDASVWVRSF
jgi:hypothetical protein